MIVSALESQEAGATRWGLWDRCYLCSSRMIP